MLPTLDALTPEQRPFRPYGSAYDALYAKDLEVLCSGPAGTGKSRTWLEKMHLLMQEFKGARALMLRKTRKSLTDAALVTFEDKVLPEGSPIKAGQKRENRHSYLYPNGSEIVLGGMDLSNIDRILSTEYDFIYIQEVTEVGEDVYEKAIRPLRNFVVPYQQIVSDCNPDRPKHWMRRRCLAGKCREVVSRHEDNPLLYNHERGEFTEQGKTYLQTLEHMSGHRLRRLRYGEWCAAEGARFPGLDEDVHQFKFSERFPFGLPTTYDILVCVDYGQRAPYCALWIAIAPNGDMFVIREDYLPGLTPEEQAQRIAMLTGRNELISVVRMDPSMWNKLPDPLGTRRGTVTQDICIADYYRAVLGSDPRFGGRIERGFNRSRHVAFTTIEQCLGRGNGYPDLFVEQGCTNLWEELEGAEWAEDEARGNKLEDIAENLPDHAITALYYGIHAHVHPPDDGVPKPLPTGAEMRAVKLQEIYANDVRSISNELARTLGRTRRY